MDLANRGRNRRRLPGWVLPVLTWAIALGSLIWVFHGVDLRKMAADLLRLQWHWVAAAVIAEIMVYVIQGWRWTILLRPVGKAPVLRSIRAVYVGVFANEVLPLRSGEVIRCFLQARWNDISFPTVLSSFVIERVFDGIWLAVAFYLTTLYVRLPGFMEEMGKVLAIVVIVAVVILAYFKFHKHHARAAISRRPWLSWLHHLVDGLHDMGDSPSFYFAALASIPYLALQVVPFWALMKNYELGLSFWAAFVVLIAVRLGTILPQAPGNVGSFQFFTVASLALFGVDKSTAAGLSLLMFTVITLPLLIVGFIALAVTGVKLNELRHHVVNGMARPPEAAAQVERR